MQITVNVRGYELFVDFAKEKPGPKVLISPEDKLTVGQVSEIFRYINR